MATDLLAEERDAKFRKWLQEKELRDKALEVRAAPHVMTISLHESLLCCMYLILNFVHRRTWSSSTILELKAPNLS